MTAVVAEGSTGAGSAAADLADLWRAETAQSHAHDYDGYHAKRFEHLLALVGSMTPRPRRILDVGASSLSARLAATYEEVWTLGFAGAAAGERHIVFDLNAVAHGAAITGHEPFDLVLFCEVVEHLHVPAEAALIALAEVLAPGGRLILQTPNAAEVMKRVALLFGRQPYEKLRLNPLNPGHFREYTMAELREAASTAGLVVELAQYLDYFEREAPAGFHPVRLVLDRLRRWAPSLRAAQTLVLRRPTRS